MKVMAREMTGYALISAESVPGRDKLTKRRIITGWSIAAAHPIRHAFLAMRSFLARVDDKSTRNDCV